MHSILVTLFISHYIRNKVLLACLVATTRKINSAPFSTNWLWHTISFFRLQSCFAQKQLEGTMILISRSTTNYLHQGSRNVKNYGEDNIIWWGLYALPDPDTNRINLSANLLWKPKRSGGPVHTHMYSGYLKCKYIIGSDFWCSEWQKQIWLCLFDRLLGAKYE